MRRPYRRAFVFLLAGGLGTGASLALAAGPGNAATPGGLAVAPGSDPWAALDRLEPRSAIGAPGWRVLVGAGRREAVKDDLTARLALGWEPRGTLGFRLEGRSLPGPSGRSGHEVEAQIIWRRPRVRAALGVSRLAWGTASQASLSGSLHGHLLPVLLAGANLRAFPGERSWAPEIDLGLYLAQGPWWAGVGLRSGLHRQRLAVGGRGGRGLAWFVAYDGGNPSVGMAWRLGPVELRAEETAHPDLGSVSEVALVWGGLAS